MYVIEENEVIVLMSRDRRPAPPAPPVVDGGKHERILSNIPETLSRQVRIEFADMRSATQF